MPTDDTYRLKIKIGPHEFEAEGPVQVVQDQFAVFRELVFSPAANAPIVTVLPAPTPASILDSPSTITTEKQEVNDSDNHLDKIMRVENRIVSLTVPADSSEEAILLLLYGQKILRKNDSVTGAEIMEGITATGGLAVNRADRFLDKLAATGDVIVIGEHRSRRYRLTNAGLTKARQSASNKLAIVP
jgi:hypothetical protein